MRVLVVGNNGYMGRHLMTGLSRDGLDGLGASSADGSGIDSESGLLPESFTVETGTDTVVYMAQSPRYRDVPAQASHVLASNALSAVRLAVAARAAGVRRFVYLSTGTVYSPSFSPLAETAPLRRDSWYVLSKLHGEEALGLFRQDMEVVVVRPFGVYGPGQSGRLVPNLIEAIKNNKPITLQPRLGDASDQEGLRISLCHIDDATNILLHIIKNGGPSCLNLAGPDALSIKQISTAIGGALGISPQLQKSNVPRDSDLISDTRLLTSTITLPYTKFDAGVFGMLGAHDRN